MSSSTSLDSLGMLDATAGMPEQIEQAVGATHEVHGLPSRDEIENVVVLGMGGSGIAGDFCAAIAGPFMPVPVVVQKGYAPPQFVNERTLVIACSFSGNTEETIEAASMASIDGARMVVIAAGGELEKLASTWGASFIPVDRSIPMPRAGLGAMAMPALQVLGQVGLFPGAEGWIDQAVEQLKRRRDELLADGSAAHLLARRLGQGLPLMYGGGSLGAVAALRWKNQFNENAKIPAFQNVVPELTHNEVCGWGQHGDLTRQVFRLITLRHDHEHPQIARRFELIAEATAEVVSGVEEVAAEGEGALAQLLDLIIVGDFVTVYAAFEAGIDPGPVPILDDIKRQLAEDL